MPGISISYSNEIGRESHNNALNKLLFFDNYSSKIVRQSQKLNASWTKYKHYPCTTFEINGFICVLEGYMYSSNDDEGTVRHLINCIIDNRFDEIEEWMVESDAEFLLTAIDKNSEKVYILNDALGRLPLFYYCQDNTICVSRELKFILDLNHISPDPMGIAQTLLFRYPLGNRTLYKGVSQLSPGTLITIHSTGIETTNIHDFNIGNKIHSNKSVEENARNIMGYISDSCKRRSEIADLSLISLSGGLDSRGIAACYSSNELPYVSATYSKSDNRTVYEVKYAKKVAEILNCEWEEWRLPKPTSSEFNKLLEMKCGMNYLRMGYILNFLEDLRSEYGEQLHYVTGDGGAKFSSWVPPKHFGSDDEVVEYILNNTVEIPLEGVAEIVDVTKVEIEKELAKRIKSYPCTDSSQKYVYFLIRERSLKWGLHGEDRNRYYFWSVAPLYSYPVFKYVMGVPDDQKRGGDLYNSVISGFDQSVLEVRYANYNAKVNSLEHKLKRKAYNIISGNPKIKNKVVSVVSPGKSDNRNENLVNMIEQIDNEEAYEPLNINKIKDEKQLLSGTQSDVLETVLISVEEFCKHSDNK